MAWSDLVAQLDSSCISILGGVPATFIPQNGSGNQTIQVLIQPPAMEEDFIPGGSPGTAVLRLFVLYSTITPGPQRGDQITVNGAAYVIVDSLVDQQGSAVLKLRAQ